MKDLKDRAEKLRLDAIDCDLIAKLATDDDKRKAFEYLAEQYRAMAEAIEHVMAQRIDAQVRVMARPPDRSKRSP